MRVIAGLARGRRLRAPDVSAVRPTGDKLKGAIFSSLEALALKLGYEREVEEGNEKFPAALAWPKVLDLYAGSGALGIEALSRGAEWADFVESNPLARRIIEANLKLTGLAQRATVHSSSVQRAVSTLERTYDLILADPPYDDVDAGSVLEEVGASPLVTERTVLVWEHRSGCEVSPRSGQLVWRRSLRHGLSSVSLFTGPRAWPVVAEGVNTERPGRSWNGPELA